MCSATDATQAMSVEAYTGLRPGAVARQHDAETIRTMDSSHRDCCDVPLWIMSRAVKHEQCDVIT